MLNKRGRNIGGRSSLAKKTLGKAKILVGYGGQNTKESNATCVWEEQWKLSPKRSL